jgi:hypothetical protein
MVAAVRPAPARLSRRSTTVPITVAPSAFAHWHRIRPTPPAARERGSSLPLHPWNAQQHAHGHALGIIAAGLSNEISSGSLTNVGVDQRLLGIAPTAA